MMRSHLVFFDFWKLALKSLRCTIYTIYHVCVHIHPIYCVYGLPNTYWTHAHWYKVFFWAGGGVVASNTRYVVWGKNLNVLNMKILNFALKDDMITTYPSAHALCTFMCPTFRSYFQFSTSLLPEIHELLTTGRPMSRSPHRSPTPGQKSPKSWIFTIPKNTQKYSQTPSRHPYNVMESWWLHHGQPFPWKPTEKYLGGVGISTGNLPGCQTVWCPPWKDLPPYLQPQNPVWKQTSFCRPFRMCLLSYCTVAILLYCTLFSIVL